MAKKKTERQYTNEIIKRMKNVGVFREDFMPAIERTAALYVRRETIQAEYEESGESAVIEYTNKAGATNCTKNPRLTVLLDIYNQLLAYERELGLTPAALKKVNEASTRQPKKSALGDALKALSG